MDHAEINDFLRRLTPRRDPVLTAMERYARRRRFPIIGPLAGRLLYQLALICRAENILELGSGFGYSAYWFSLAMGKRGRIVMTDTSEENRNRALTYFKKGKRPSRFVYIVGDALKAASQLDESFDIILNDIDKSDYPGTIDLAARLLRPGGLFITDNLLWSGRVFDRRVNDRSTTGIRRFTRQLYADDRFFTTIIPIRDGLALAVRR